VREQMRQRMDRPREKEIARLMGKREEGTQTTAEKARAPQKRHPNVVQGVLKREKWKNGFEVCEHTESGWLEEAWAAIDRGEEEAKARTYYTGGGTVRVTVHKGRDVKVSMRPLHHLTRFLHTMPTLEEGEGVAVTTEKESSGDSQSEEMDAMAEQECFFGTNAMPNKPVCRVGRIFTQCPSKHCAALGTRPEHRHMETQPRHAAAQVTLLEASFVFLPGLRRGENSSSEQHTFGKLPNAAAAS
jgi:hypothetical protein